MSTRFTLNFGDGSIYAHFPNRVKLLQLINNYLLPCFVDIIAFIIQKMTPTFAYLCHFLIGLEGQSIGRPGRCTRR
jgi:uncharacterized membrane protein YczE